MHRFRSPSVILRKLSPSLLLTGSESIWNTPALPSSCLEIDSITPCNLSVLASMLCRAALAVAAILVLVADPFLRTEKKINFCYDKNERYIRSRMMFGLLSRSMWKEERDIPRHGAARPLTLKFIAPLLSCVQLAA